MVSHNYKIDSDNKNAIAGVILVLLYGDVGDGNGCNTVKLKFECLESLCIIQQPNL